MVENSAVGVTHGIGGHIAGFLRPGVDTGIGPDLSVRGLAFDCLVATLFYGMGSVFLPIFDPHATLPDFIFVALINIPLVIRRRLPRTSFALVQVVTLAQIWAHSWIGIHDATALFSLYSLVGLTSRRAGLIGLGVELMCIASGSITRWWGFIDTQLFGRESFVSGIFVTAGMVALVLATWAGGERLRHARAGLVALAGRAAQLEREREQQSQIAAAAERSRIAREMHDVIAHALSVMIAQADGGVYVVDQDPAAARQALTRISDTGRDSLTQMRGLLGLLRDGGSGGGPGESMPDGERGAGFDDRGAATGTGGPAVAPRPGPQPGLGELEALISQAEDSGLQVTLAHRGNPGQASGMVGLASYRIVQECLSNARRHGGQSVEITLVFEDDGVALEVCNEPPRTPEQTAHRGGHGLQGMQERVAAVGGRLHTEQTRAGFEVAVWLPYAPTPAAQPSTGRPEPGPHLSPTLPGGDG